jgi:hypothetical protein
MEAAMREHSDVGALLDTVRDLPREHVPAVLAALAARLAEPADAESLVPAPPLVDGPGENARLLTAAEAAEIARVPARVVYGWSRRTDWRAFVHRLSRKVLRIEERGFRRWLDRQGQPAHGR